MKKSIASIICFVHQRYVFEMMKFDFISCAPQIYNATFLVITCLNMIWLTFWNRSEYCYDSFFKNLISIAQCFYCPLFPYTYNKALT